MKKRAALRVRAAIVTKASAIFHDGGPNPSSVGPPWGGGGVAGVEARGRATEVATGDECCALSLAFRSFNFVNTIPVALLF